MWNRFGHTALVVALLAGTPQFAQAQSQPSPTAATGRDASMTVFHGTPGEVGSAPEIPGSGSSAPPGYTTSAAGSAAGTTVFRGTPAGAPSSPPPPPWVSPPPALGSGR
ncbi:MAG: hypothetical protein WA709_17690 [Stellaceae bacterium]